MGQFDILDVLRKTGLWMTVKEIAETAGVGQTTVYYGTKKLRKWKLLKWRKALGTHENRDDLEYHI